MKWFEYSKVKIHCFENPKIIDKMGNCYFFLVNQNLKSLLWCTTPQKLTTVTFCRLQILVQFVKTPGELIHGCADKQTEPYFRRMHFFSYFYWKHYQNAIHLLIVNFMFCSNQLKLKLTERSGLNIIYSVNKKQLGNSVTFLIFYFINFWYLFLCILSQTDYNRERIQMDWKSN